MDPGHVLLLNNPRKHSSIFSKLFFIWMVNFCHKGTKKGLRITDLYRTLRCDRSEELTNSLERNWEDEVRKSSEKIDSPPSLIRAIIRTFFWSYMTYGFILLFQVILFKSLQPLVLGYFIKLFTLEGKDNHNEMYVSGVILILQLFFMVVFMHHTEFGLASIGMRIRIAVSSLIYRKLLKLDNKSLGQTAAGQVVNLLSNDVSRFDLVASLLHYLWIIPFQMILLAYLIWREVEISTLAGLLFMLCFTLPVQGYLAKITSRLRLKTALRTDYRICLMNEIVSGIQIIKMYAWERPFELIIEGARKREIGVVTKTSFVRGVFLSCMVFIERATLFATITCYAFLGNHITADKVFSLAQCFNVLQLGLVIWYPLALTSGAETLISLKRLREFLMFQEKPKSVIEHHNTRDVVFQNVTASWNDILTISNFDLRITEGSLCAIVGPVGAGKSSLLQILLGELPPKDGTIKIGGSISYVSQEPWLFAATVRSNILFGKEYDRTFYRRVVRVCALEKDFRQFPQGDMTVVGERGVSLSGGQRARITLARALYRQADIYLLDDPLSAVDAHVGKYLFQECILDFLKGKTRILVTHQLQYLKEADYIVVVEQGRITARGTFDELIINKVDFTKLLVSEEKEEDNKTEVAVNTRSRCLSITASTTSEMSEILEAPENVEDITYPEHTPFLDYVKASGNNYTVFLVIVSFIVAQATCNCADLWITFWTQKEEEVAKINKTKNMRSTFDREPVISIYAAIILLAIILTLGRSFAFFKIAMTASKNLHNRMFHAILHAPMRFFEINPSGRILNRFSKDMGTIDELLPMVLIDAIQILLVMSGILIMVIIANYYMVIIMVMMGFLFLKIRRWYVEIARGVKHLEGTTKSNVFSHMNSSFNGITTIRACRAEKILAKQFDDHQDNHTSAWFLTIAIRVCFGLWLDLLCVIFVALVIFGFILLHQFTAISGSFVGLAISQSLILTGMLPIGMKQTAEVVNQLTSVERIMQYTKLDNEKSGENETPVVSPFPSRGAIEFQNLSLRYSELDPLVLRNISLVINPESKIGIVGRTGAGKSSLIQALFRLASTEGKILIDDVDTKMIPLQQLRSNISIIPQEPVLFSATLRYNLDPFCQFDDTELWKVLEQVELKDGIRSLDVAVTEGGSNFSVGQRQLLCLARAILRDNTILVLDEATANVDPRTDSLIQETIRKKFRRCTVLTIAHRLNSIMDSDKILVMDSGRMVEFDHPHVLLKDKESLFSKLVAETGPAMAHQLKQIAEKSFNGSLS